MRKRNLIYVVAIAMLAGLLCGCVSPVTAPSSSTNVPTTTATPSSTTEVILNSLPMMVQIDGRLFYLGAPLEGNVEIGEDQIAGYTTASCSEIPDEDGACNFAPVGTPYAPWSTEEYPDTYVIYVEILGVTQWRLLRPDEGN